MNYLQGQLNTWCRWIWAIGLRTTISLSSIKFISIQINTPTYAVYTLYTFVVSIFSTFRQKLATSTSCTESFNLTGS